MKKITFKNGQAPYISDTTLNQMQDNIEEEIGIVEKVLETTDSEYGIKTTVTRKGSIVQVMLFCTELKKNIPNGAISYVLASLPEEIRPVIKTRNIITTTVNKHFILTIDEAGKILMEYVFGEINIGNQIVTNITFIAK